MSKFVHLHVHSEFSLLDGANRIKDLPVRAKELGMDSIAITDHGVMFGVIDFYKACKANGVKPIIGCEVYVAPRTRFDKEAGIDNKYNHLILLAKNNNGYKNLSKLVSLGFIDGYYYKPRIDKEILEKYHEDLICCSACLAGELPQAILKNDMEKAEETALWFKNLFGEDYYLEIQANSLREQALVNQKLITLSQKLNIPIVATNDAHYLKKEDYYNHEVLLCVQTGKRMTDSDRMSFSTNDFYIKSPEEMEEYFANVPQALENTVKIAEKCNVEFEFGNTILPNYDVPPEFETHYDYLRKLSKDGMQKRYGDSIPKEIQEREEYELSVIKTMGYVDYFLIVWDYINWAKSQGIPVGPGRGSGAGSIVAYAIGITDIDPIKYSLIFERFLNPERISMPDIDIDICQERRQEVIDYVANKYGKDKVAQIITFGTMKARAAIRDVGRVLDIPLIKIDKTAKMIGFGENIESSLKNSVELQDIYEKDAEIRKVLDYSKRLEGKVRHASIHAAGVVITKESLDEEVPVYYDSKSATVATQYQMKELEELGILKMDFLGLRNLTVIQRAIDYIKENRGEIVELSKISLEDEESYLLLRKGDTLGVFQLESEGMRKLIMRLSPDRFEDIVALLALYRPGPLGSGMVEDFINVKKGKAEIKYPHPMLENILKETYGVILYQEQVMKIANVMADYSLGEADLLRRAMGKKNFEIMEENRNKFVERSVKNGVNKEKAEEIFALIDKFAGYGFNKSHSAAYALIAFWTAYLKVKYPAEFFAALMTSERNSNEKLAIYIENAKRNGIEVLAPDVNKSEAKFTVEKNKIIFGISAIKNLGDGMAVKIVEERKKAGIYKDYEEFAYRAKKFGINRKGMEALVLSGSLDCLNGNRREKYEAIDGVLEKSAKMIARENDIRLSLFGEGQIVYNFKMPIINEFGAERVLNGEKEYLGIYFSGHPLDRHKTIISKLDLNSITSIIEDDLSSCKTCGMIQEMNKKVTKAGKVMAEFILEDYYGRVKVIVFPQDYGRFAHILVDGRAIYLEGSISIDSFGDVEEKKIIARELRDIEEIDSIASLKIYILLENEKIGKAEKLKEIIKKHSGKCETILAVKDGEKRNMIKLGKAYNCAPSKQLIEEIEELLGEGVIKIR